MAQPVDVTQTPEYLELLQVSEEMEADFKRMLAEKDDVIAVKERESQAKVAQLEASLADRDKELESYVEELEAKHDAALRAKDGETADLKRALAEANDRLQVAAAAGEVRQRITLHPLSLVFSDVMPPTFPFYFFSPCSAATLQHSCSSCRLS
jgi:hypothetical protein